MQLPQRSALCATLNEEKYISDAGAQQPRRPSGPESQVSYQKTSVRRPHRTKLPSNTDQSEGVNPHSLPSLSTELIIVVPM